MPDASAYCTARTVELAEDADGFVFENVVDTEFDTFDEVLGFLERTNGWSSSALIGRWTFEPETAQQNLETLGGFVITLTNRWGGKVWVGVGCDVWYLQRLIPEPELTFSDNPEVAAGWLIFHWDGWTFHDFKADQLVSRQACLVALCEWLKQDIFPKSSRPTR